LTHAHVSVIIARMKSLGLSITLSLILLSACSSQPAPTINVTPTSRPPAASATPTVPPSPTATATPSPTPTFTPTPKPEQAMQEAALALRDGDFGTAIQKYQAVINGSATPDQIETAQLNLAVATARSGDAPGAIELFTQFIAQHPKSNRVADAWFYLGEAYFDRAAWQDAITAYQNYLKLRSDLIPDFVFERIGDAYMQLSDAANAIKSYEAALAAASGTSNVANLREKLALAYRQGNEPQNALAQYDAILSFAQQPRYRASIMLQAGQALLDAGETTKGYARFIELVNTYPDRNEAYQALLALVNAEVPVYEFQRGLVDYYAKQYDAAIAAFERFIVANEDHGNAHYYIGLSYKGAGNISAALKAFNEIITQHPEASRWGEAWIEKANTQAVGGDVDGAVDTLTTFVKKNPTAPLAPTAIWNAAGLLEDNGDFKRAIDLNLQLQTDYPNDANASEALMDAGLDAYRVNDSATALTAWRTLSNTYPLSDLHAASLLWQGKVANDRVLLSQLATSDAYYGLRAGDILSGTSALPFVRGNFDVDPDEGRAEAEQWLASWLQVKPESLRQLPAAVINDARFKRGNELWQLGKLSEGKAEFQALREAYSADPAVLYPLAIYYRDIGLYYPAIVAAASLIRLSPAGSTENAPQFLQRLVYPIYYANLIIPEAEANNIDPMIIFSLMRAESLFDGAVTSSAAAGGLMQIIPDTGEQIARDLRWSDYQQSDLYRPIISVKFGTYYLRRYGLDYLDGDMYAAWAAYNGGPGNAQRWTENSNGDTDLFVENISLGETRLYIDRLRENLAWYQRLYGK
jgi:soluble lytic murein transglycosylase